jgi:hypothetical protein
MVDIHIILCVYIVVDMNKNEKARTAAEALTGIAAGYIRRVPQVQSYSTFDFLYKKVS